MKDDKLPAEEFLKGFLNNFEEKCGSCRFFNTSNNECKENHIKVEQNTLRCEKWRYFA